MLQMYAGRVDDGVATVSRDTVEPDVMRNLPPDINDWPKGWFRNFSQVSGAIRRLLPIDPIHAEAAAEIAVRCEYSRQVSERP